MTNFTIYPAIDLWQGRVVRLFQGNLKKKTIYGEDPAAFARLWFSAGATWIHLVNLDGAFEQTESANLTALKAILYMQQNEFPLRHIQFGGGVRSLAGVDQLLQAGVGRVIFGTIAATHPELVKMAIQEFGSGCLAVALDVRDNQLSIRGWVEDLPTSPLDFALKMVGLGIRTLIYTDISRDGASTGTNLATARELACQTGAEIILSGGVASLDDCRAADKAGLSGIIIGRALYERIFSIEEALSIETESSGQFS